MALLKRLLIGKPLKTLEEGSATFEARSQGQHFRLMHCHQLRMVLSRLRQR